MTEGQGKSNIAPLFQSRAIMTGFQFNDYIGGYISLPFRQFGDDFLHD